MIEPGEQVFDPACARSYPPTQEEYDVLFALLRIPPSDEIRRELPLALAGFVEGVLHEVSEGSLHRALINKLKAVAKGEPNCLDDSSFASLAVTGLMHGTVEPLRSTEPSAVLKHFAAMRISAEQHLKKFPPARGAPMDVSFGAFLLFLYDMAEISGANVGLGSNATLDDDEVETPEFIAFVMESIAMATSRLRCLLRARAFTSEKSNACLARIDSLDDRTERNIADALRSAQQYEHKHFGGSLRARARAAKRWHDTFMEEDDS